MSLPLITYSPRYHEVGTIEYKDSPYINGLQIPGATKGVFEVKFPIPPPNAIVPPGTIGPGYVVYLAVNEDQDLSAEFIRNFYIVFAAVSFTSIKYMTQRAIYLIDNNGNHYHIPAALPPGSRLPNLGVPMDTTGYFSFFSFPVLTKKNKPLPDSFLDAIINHQTEVLSKETQTYAGPINWKIAPPNPSVDVIPHSPMDLRSELATYIETLEKCRKNYTTSSVNVQTNYNTMNREIQTNRNRNGMVNALRKTCAGKNCNVASEGVQTNNYRNRNRNGFVKTLRRSCAGKNCNANNRGIQTNAAYIGRRHSMVNALRRTVRSTRPNSNV